MKKVLSVCLAVALMLSLFVVPVSADVPEITVLLNGEAIEFDVPPQIIDNRTMVPLRAISEALDAKVEWDEQTQTITIETF